MAKAINISDLFLTLLHASTMDTKLARQDRAFSINRTKSTALDSFDGARTATGIPSGGMS